MNCPSLSSSYCPVPGAKFISNYCTWLISHHGAVWPFITSVMPAAGLVILFLGGHIVPPPFSINWIHILCCLCSIVWYMWCGVMIGSTSIVCITAFNMSISHPATFFICSYKYCSDCMVVLHMCFV